MTYLATYYQIMMILLPLDCRYASKLLRPNNNKLLIAQFVFDDVSPPQLNDVFMYRMGGLIKFLSDN